MKSWAEIEVFTEEDLRYWRAATRLVAAVDNPTEDPEYKNLLRCHELARAVGAVLSLPFMDGLYGRGVEHTWLTLGNWKEDIYNAKILDVYVPGSYPQVQLIHYGSYHLNFRELYRQGIEYERTDIKWDVVSLLVAKMQKS